MNRIDITFAINDSYIEHLCVAIFSLLTNNKKHKFALYIISAGLSAKSKSKLNKLLTYFENATIEYVNISAEKHRFDELPITMEHINSHTTYYRYIISEVLPNIDKILYLDADILVVDDIASLWDTAIDDYYVAGAEGLFRRTKQYKEGYFNILGLSESDPYINAGVLLFNLNKIREDNKVQELFDNTVRHTDVKWQDQDIINMTFRGGVKLLDVIYNFPAAKEYYDCVKDRMDQAVILHYITADKPWSHINEAEGFLPHNIYSEYVDDYDRLMNEQLDNRTEKYGLFKYTTENIGDDIQSIAARRFLPRVDYYIDRDDIDNTNMKDASVVKIIMNGWYTHRPENWPPLVKKIDPLLVSMYFNAISYEPRTKQAVLSRPAKDFFAKFGPVGCRDLATQKFLAENDIESFFSGCMTLTIKKSPKIKKKDYILAVDLPDEVLAELRNRTNRRIIVAYADITTRSMTLEERLRMGELYLALYQSAHAVVTTRLHSVLPSLAIETPVLFVQKTSHSETQRFGGLIDLANNMSQEDFLNKKKKYNVDNPPKNKDMYKKIRKDLEGRAKNHTGYDNPNGFLTDESILSYFDNLDMLQSMLNALAGSCRADHMRKLLENKTAYTIEPAEAKILELMAVSKKYDDLKARCEQITASESYKAGLVITAPARFLKRFAKSIVDKM